MILRLIVIVTITMVVALTTHAQSWGGPYAQRIPQQPSGHNGTGTTTIGKGRGERFRFSYHAGSTIPTGECTKNRCRWNC